MRDEPEREKKPDGPAPCARMDHKNEACHHTENTGSQRDRRGKADMPLHLAVEHNIGNTSHKRGDTIDHDQRREIIDGSEKAVNSKHG